MRLYRVVWACVLVSLNGMSSGCAPPSPESISRERLSKIGVQFEKASADMPYANIPAAETGRTVVTVPCYWGGDSPQGWTDEDFKGAIDDQRKLSDKDYLMLRLLKRQRQPCSLPAIKAIWYHPMIATDSLRYSLRQ